MHGDLTGRELVVAHEAEDGASITDALEQTFDHAHGVIAGVRVDQYDDETPCAEWSVRDLLDHMVGVVAGLGSAAAGKEPSTFELGDDPAAEFQAAAAAAMQAWRTPGVLDAIIDATGQPAALPEDVAAAAMEASRATISPDIRPGRFGPEVDAPSGGSATDALVAFLGRRP